jgi:hypothetical protein
MKKITLSKAFALFFALIVYTSMGWAQSVTIEARPSQIDISESTSLSAVLVTLADYPNDDARYRLYSGSNQYNCWNGTEYVTSNSYAAGPEVPGTPSTSTTWWILFERGSNVSTAANYRDRLGPEYSSNYQTQALPAATEITNPVLIDQDDVAFAHADYAEKLVVLGYDAEVDGTLITATSTTLATGDFTLVVEDGTTIQRIELRSVDNTLLESKTGVWPSEEEPEDFETLFQFSAVDENLPSWFGSQLARGFAVFNNNLYVANRNAPAGQQVQVHNRLTGEITGSLNTTGVEGGTFPLNDVEVSADGVVLLCNLAQSTGGIFTIYQLDETNPAEVLITLSLADIGASRMGDKFTVVGSFNDGSAKIYAADASTPRVFVWSMTADSDKQGFSFGAPEIIATNAIGATNGSNASVAPLPNGQFYITGGGVNIYKLNADGSLIGMVPGGIVATGSSALKYLGTDGNDEILAVFLYGAGNEKARILRIPNGDPTAAVIEFDTPTLGTVNSTGNADVTFVPATDDMNADLYVLSATNGLALYVTQNFDLEYPVYLPPAEPVFARAQFIHNSADLAATSVDVFVNGTLFYGDFDFRTATPFVDVPAEVELTIDIAPAGAGIGSSVFNTNVTLAADETYVIVANGIVSATGYDPAPAFTVYPFAPAREVGLNPTETDLLVFHGSTDAPEVSVWAMGGDAALFNFSYGEFAGYLGLPTDDYVIEVRTADGSTVVAAYTAPLGTLNLEGAALTVVASGFLNPANNSNGPAFGLFVATAAGGDLLELPLYEEEVPFVINEFPWLEGFEADSESREYWTQVQEVGTANWIFATGAGGGAITTAYEGSLNARFVSQSGTNSPITKLVTPLIDISELDNPIVSFFYGQEVWFGDQNQTKVYYRVSETDDWVEIAHYTGSVTAWTQETLELPNPSATYQLAFEGINNYGRANVLDNVWVGETPPVFTVTFVIEDEDGAAIGDAIVTLDGVANPEGDYVFEDLLAGEYAYSVVALGYEDAEGTVTVVDEDVTVTVVMIEAEVIIPLTEFFENFDDVTAPALPEGWSKIVQATNTTAAIETYALTSPLSPPNHIRMLNGNDANPLMLLIGPKITNFNTNWFTFWSKHASATQQAKVIVGYMVNPNNPASFVGVDTLLIEGTTYRQNFVQFSELEQTDEYFLALKYLPEVTFRTVFLDDFTWEEAPEDPILSVTPDSGNFGLVDVDGSGSLSFMAKNIGTGTLVIEESDMVFTGDDADLFSIHEDVEFPISLGIAEEYTFQVVFSPLSVGAKTATLNITHTGENTPFDIPLTGEGLGVLSEFFENFDEVTPPALPGGWSAIVQTDNVNAGVITTTLTTPYSLPNHARLANSGDLGALLMLVGPKVDSFESNWLTFFTKMSLGTHTESLVIGYTNDRNDPDVFVPLDTLTVAGNVYSRVVYEFPETLLDTDEYHIVFKAVFSATFRNLFLDDITWETKPTTGIIGVNPDEFEWTGIFVDETSLPATFTIGNFGVADLVFEETGITITGDDADLFNLIISDDLEFPLTLAPDETFQIQATFSPVDEGTFNADISLVAGDQTKLVPLTGGSIDPTVTPPVAYDFIGAFPPLHWRRFSGELTENTVLVPTTGGWVHSKFGNVTALPENNATKVNIWSTRDFWLVTPPVQLGDGTTEYMLTFDLALTGYNNQNPATLGAEQSFSVVVSTDNGQTWVPENILQQWTSADNISNTGEQVTLELTDYTEKVLIGFYGRSRPGGDVDLHVTNVQVREIIYNTVTFNVEDSEGNPITDATVVFDGETLTAAPYVFEDILAGNYDYEVSKMGYLPVSGTLTVEDDDLVVPVVLLDAFTVDFTVTDGTNPIIGANINIFDAADMQVGALITDTDGEASVILSDGTYTYDVFAVGYDLLEDQTFTIVDEDLSISVILTGPDPMTLPFVENFNDTVLPLDWIIVDQPNHTAIRTWEFIDLLGTNSIDGTPFAIINSDAAGSGGGTLNSMLYTPAIDASAVEGVLMLSFEQYYRHLGANAFGRVEVWDGSAWITLANYTATVGSWTAPDMAMFDITEYANANLRVRFHYTDGSSWAWYWAIDNVEIKDLQFYNLTLNVNPDGWGTVTGAGEHLEGSQVEVTATANPGYEFLNWTDEEGDVVSTEPDNIITMPDSDLTLTANFILGPVDPLAMTTFLDATGENKPVQIGDVGNARAAALYQDRYVIVPSREGGTNVWVWDILSPHLDPFALDKGDGIIEFGLFEVNYVQTVGDNIYVSNMTLGSNAAHPFRVYRWSSLDAEPEMILSTDGEWGRLGDAFSIIGDPATEGSIVAHVNSGGEGQRRFRKFDFVDGVVQNEDNPELITVEGTYNMNSFGTYNPIEGEDDLFLVTGNGMGIAIANLEGEVQAYIGSGIVPVRTMDPHIFYYDGKRYLSYVINNEGNSVDGAYYEVIDISMGDNVVEALSMITSVEVLNNLKAHTFTIGAGAAFLSGTNRVYHVDDEVMILSHVVARGFVLETTGTLPATYALTLEANPAEGGTVEGGGDYYEGATVPVSAVAAGGYEFVNWTVGGDVVSTDAEFHFTMPGDATTLTANFETVVIEDVATLLELRGKPADGTLYRYTGDAVIVAMDGHRNRKFLQDATAAIMIDDNDGVITTDYDLYDVITNVTGEIVIFRDMVQFKPAENTDPSTANTPVDPTVFMLDEVTQGDQAKLIQFMNVTFMNINDGQEFVNGTNYTITDGENEFVVRTDFWNVDYIGTEIPTDPVNISGVVITFFETLQLVPRFAADIEEYTEPSGFNVTFNVDMTPAEGFDPANDVVYITGSMFGWAEPGTQPENQTMTRVDQSMIWTKTVVLEAGTYQYKYFLNAGWDGGEWDGAPDRVVEVTGDMVVDNVWRDLVNVDDFNTAQINVFPNPARDNFNITAGSMIRSIVIADITGKVVYNDIINDTQTRIYNVFETGIYIVRIYTDEGVFVRKLQIQK